MSFKIKKAVIDVDFGKSHASTTFEIDKPVDHPFLGDNKFLVPLDAKMTEADVVHIPLFNINDQSQIIRNVEKNGVYYLYLQKGFCLDKIIVEPNDIHIDIFFKGKQLIYCFYNTSNRQTIKIVAHKQKDDKKILEKLAVDSSDLIWRQYFIRKAVFRPEMDFPEIMTPSQVADYLQLKLKTIQNWTSENKIPFLKVGGTPRYSKAELDQALKQGKLGKKIKK
jgi:excisionase family DNA binding protein